MKILIKPRQPRSKNKSCFLFSASTRAASTSVILMSLRLISKDAQEALLSNKKEMGRYQERRRMKVAVSEAGSVRWQTYFAAKRMMAQQMTLIVRHKRP